MVQLNDEFRNLGLILFQFGALSRHSIDHYLNIFILCSY